jgi:hypothetical protein
VTFPSRRRILARLQTATALSKPALTGRCKHAGSTTPKANHRILRRLRATPDPDCRLRRQSFDGGDGLRGPSRRERRTARARRCCRRWRGDRFPSSHAPRAPLLVTRHSCERLDEPLALIDGSRPPLPRRPAKGSASIESRSAFHHRVPAGRRSLAPPQVRCLHDAAARAFDGAGNIASGRHQRLFDPPRPPDSDEASGAGGSVRRGRVSPESHDAGRSAPQRFLQPVSLAGR